MNRSFLAFLILCFGYALHAEIRLPKLIGDGMVLQRNTNVEVWGWADPGERILISFGGRTHGVITDDNGDWSVVLPMMDAGGPYEMRIEGKNEIVLHDVMIGDVWICSGQSNMELPMRRVAWKYPEEMHRSSYPTIRQFYVPREYDFVESHTDLSSGQWVQASETTIGDFSAAAYFFASEVYARHQVPIGLINTSLGGSPVQAWMSQEALIEFPAYYQEARRFRNQGLIDSIQSADAARANAWFAEQAKKDAGLAGKKKQWSSEDFRDNDWETMDIPGYWADTDAGDIHGVVWFRRKIDVPKSFPKEGVTFVLGRVVDADSTFVNGVFVGTTTYQYPPRRYEIPAGVLRDGENTIAVRVINQAGRGGFVGDKTYALVAGKDTLDVRGKWSYKVGTPMPELASQTFIRWKPLGLYNAMIHPLIRYRVKGTIWYQGESNTAHPQDYHELFDALIRNWRRKWQQDDMPFLYVQLANFMESDRHPASSDWALVREAQLQTLTTPYTGMAVTIDIGEWNDIHPLNKKDVGYRLALWAERLAYKNKEIVASGPVFKSAEVQGRTIRISFSETGGGLKTRGYTNELNGFAIAGADSIFYWAHAEIDGNTVVVRHPDIEHPVSVRYAWGNNPDDANLINAEGLPASPFRTDTWKE